MNVLIKTRGEINVCACTMEELVRDVNVLAPSAQISQPREWRNTRLLFRCLPNLRYAGVAA